MILRDTKIITERISPKRYFKRRDIWFNQKMDNHIFLGISRPWKVLLDLRLWKDGEKSF